MAKWERIDNQQEDSQPVDMGKGRWSKIENEETAAYQRSVFLLNARTKETYELHEYLDWDGNLINRRGDLRLQPVMNVTASLEAEFDDMDKDTLLKKAAPALQQTIQEITGEAIALDDLMENLEIRTAGNWRGFRHGPKFQRLN